MADITKTNEQIIAWEKNLEKLKNGEFGDLKVLGRCKETLARYWKAQAEAGYPSANDNFEYFLQSITAKKEKQERAITCKNCFYDRVCPHFKDDDATNCKAYTDKKNVVVVVRCKDCVHWGGTIYGFVCRKFSGIETKICMGEDHYCSYGERKEE